MRPFASIVFLVLLFVGCNKNAGGITSPIDVPAVIQVSYSLTDTLGNPKALFREGESFILHYSVANASGRDLHCWYKGPLDFFNVLSNNQVIASSHWDQAEPADLWTYGTFPKDTIISDSWVGPNNPWRTPRLSLCPGLYNYSIFIGIRFVDTVQIVTAPYSTGFAVLQSFAP